MEVVQLEEWEEAPGRNQSTTSASRDSKSKLGLVPGCTLTLEKDKGVKRLASVAVGKVHVQLDGEPIFLLGSHGLFETGPGVGCVSW
ncbi:hypothetical protein VM1G_11870 [Cytospora mali]|uniref:Uncharacterized protein n=1 Tax=Cytospora mali TaxID=578113 RepID=A0A194W8G6_CYTMA|nr:hypothetical protein VM1G_11870 [Valsa mali]